MRIEKPNYSETTYPDRVEKLCTILEEKLDHVTLEYVKELEKYVTKKDTKTGTGFRTGSMKEHDRTA